MPSMKTKERTRRNSSCTACSRVSVNGANCAVDPDTSHSTMRSGLTGRRRRRTGLTGTPPVPMDDRIVRRMSRPAPPRRRWAPSFVASLRASGRIAIRIATSSSAPARRQRAVLDVLQLLVNDPVALAQPTGELVLEPASQLVHGGSCLDGAHRLAEA